MGPLRLFYDFDLIFKVKYFLVMQWFSKMSRQRIAHGRFAPSRTAPAVKLLLFLPASTNPVGLKFEMIQIPAGIHRAEKFRPFGNVFRNTRALPL